MPLRALILEDNPLQPSAREAWKAAPRALQRLDLAGTALAASELAPLLELPAMGGLSALGLDVELPGVFEARDLRGLASSPFWAQAEGLTLSGAPCAAAELGLLCRPGATDKLQILDLAGTPIGTEGVRRLCEAPFADALVELDLSHTGLDDEALSAIASSGRFVRLRRLVLAGNPLTDRGMEHLAQAPGLARLRRLDLLGTPVHARGLDAVLNGPHWALSELRFGHQRIGPAMIDVLSQSPRLSRLTELDLRGVSGWGNRILLPLAESPWLSPLCRLQTNVPGAPEVASALKARLGPRWP